jgi:hypothetical protein
VRIDFCSAELHTHLFNQISGLAPWRSSIPHPLLVINAEEHTVGGGFSLFTDQFAGTATPFPTNPLVFSILGATHPSFSEFFLILPEYVNKLTGLGVRTEHVLQLIVDATLDFITGDTEKIVSRATEYAIRTCGARTRQRDVARHAIFGLAGPEYLKLLLRGFEHAANTGYEKETYAQELLRSPRWESFVTSVHRRVTVLAALRRLYIS